MHMYVNLTNITETTIIDVHFPYMETGSNLYFDGTQVYMVVARSFAAFGSS